MPRYDFKCDRCGAAGERERPVAQRDCVNKCPHCERGLMHRQFAPTLNILVPDHFRLPMDWCLPDKEDKSAWENIGGHGSQTHAKKSESFKEHFERTVTQFD